MTSTLMFGIGILVCGLVIGWKLRSIAYDAQDWEMLRWEPDIFGFRRVGPGSKICRDEKILVAVKIDTTEIPDGGKVYE